LLTVTPGAPLAGALGDGDNLTVAGLQLTPPDMGFAANGTDEVELINLVGKIWTGTTPGTAFSLASFFSPSSPGDSLSDPWIKWDAGSGRFFAGILDISLGTLTASATTEYFASLNSGTGTALHRVTSVGVPPGTVTLSALADITVPGYSNPPAAAQKGTTTKIDSGDDRTQNVVALGTNMTVTQTIGCKPSGDTTERSCGRVYEVNNGTSTLKAARTISASGKYFFYPAATFEGSGNVGVSIGRSSSTTFGSLYTTAGTWGGTLAAPVLVKAGTATNTTTRYGDYFAAAPQPGTTNQFWVAGEIGGTSGTSFKWNTAAGPVTAS
jgi:hypothetical protein